MSPIVGLHTYSILYKTVLEIKDKETFANKTIWVIFSLACLTWTIADTIWAFYYFLTAFNPEDSILISTLYSSTSIFLFVPIFIFGITRYKKWNMLQLLLDSISISLSILLLLWILFFHEDLRIVKIIVTQSPTSILFIVIDILILVIIFIFYLSAKNLKIDTYINFIFAGVLIYVISDLYFYHLNFSDSYIPNSLIDYAYMCTFLFLATGSIYKRYFTKPKNSESKTYNHNKKQMLLFIYPLLAIIIEDINIPKITNFLIIILLNNILSTYIQASIKNEQLLVKEKEMNFLLEEKIKQRTKEITDKNNELENKNKELDFLSNKDTLTCLYNRRFFMDNLKKELESLKPLESVALFYMDLDRFKTINDMYGHQVGDQALIEISKRLEILSEGNFILARLGGDEFVLVYRGILDNAVIEELALVIIDKCSEPIEIGEYIFYVSASVGISIYPLDAKDSYTLIKNADIAMYEAKAQGKNRCIFFNTKFKDSLNRKNEIENLLKKISYDDEFELYYQPQYSIRDKKTIGAEALLRWNNKDLGSISPVEFIPIAEEIDYINSIGEWVMEKAIKQIAKWSNQSIYLKVGINISPKQLDNKNFISKLKGFLDENSVSPEYIDIEITENITIEGGYRVKQIESLFSSLGISISIDDFGTGYSSLSYLKTFPFERIKIAKPLIDVISTDNFDFQIVKALIMLAKSIGIKTIAEGVEFQEQLDILTELGCDEVQGYLLGKPMTVSHLEELLNTQNI
ncbi:diguanylate cyclase (GGDEF)-like protein [Sedimentibacter acidaminivorans]|uniref:Diguanylate cyclase (GGDEF)-like protein n=1 Tax=Sedimentibacter acidaminivorans TaxID=913099 RepID=A0ABS4GFY5_9FIRM|nr:EAL domain-containing protein [Sedimentibacter acidaminivorans]MBP1926591.1 diguanylate cyclase (GGDEF)-like protein [Sedimentibacter acidaminivorans]